MDYEKQTLRLRQLAKALLTDGKVNLVLGFQENEEAGAPSPLFARTPEDAERLIWREDCWRNLAQYLLGQKGKIAIAAKACDTRAILNLIKENQLNRDDLVIIGMACGGMHTDMGPAAGCAGCPSLLPVIYDLAVAADGSDSFSEETPPEPEENVTEWLDNTSVEARYQRFMKEIDKCILCYSCRQACPGCYCETCFVDRGRTPWQTADVETADKVAFHLTRAMHLAGRCISCGACENVCPSGVSLKYLYDGIGEFVEEMYDYRAGADPDAEQAMNRYSSDDREVGFLGGDHHDDH